MTMVGVTITQRTISKGHSIRKVETTALGGGLLWVEVYHQRWAFPCIIYVKYFITQYQSN